MIPNGSSAPGFPKVGDGSRCGRETANGAGIWRRLPVIAGFSGAVRGCIPRSGPVCSSGGVWGTFCKLVLLKEDMTVLVLTARGFFSSAVFGRCKLEQ